MIMFFYGEGYGQFLFDPKKELLRSFCSARNLLLRNLNIRQEAAFKPEPRAENSREWSVTGIFVGIRHQNYTYSVAANGKILQVQIQRQLYFSHDFSVTNDHLHWRSVVSFRVGLKILAKQQFATFYKNRVKHITAGRGDSLSVEQLYSAIHHPTMNGTPVVTPREYNLF